MTPTFTLSADNPHHRQAMAYLVRVASISARPDGRLDEYRSKLQEFTQHHEQLRDEERSA